MADSLPDSNESFALYYRTYGGDRQDESCPILVIHGLLGSTVHWHAFCKSYSELTGRKIISVDCRNHGQSPRNNLMTYPLMAGDIAETLGHLNISRAVLIGHSMGGKVAMELALSMPDSVEKLIVEDLPPMDAPAPLIAGILSAMLNLDFTQVKNSNDADDMLRESIPHDVIRAYVLTALHEDEEGKFHWLADIKNLRENLKSLVEGNESAIELKGRTPYMGETLFIAGGESQDLKNADMNEIRKIFPKADREVIPGASHFVHTDKPQEFLEIVHKFLR